MSLNLTNPRDFLEDFDYARYDDIMGKYTLVDKNRVEDQLSQTASVYAYLGCILEEARSQMEAADLEVKMADAAFRSRRREEEGKISESRLNSEVYLDPDYYVVNKEYILAQKKYGWMKALCSAMHSKHEALIQLSSNHRAEMKLNSL